MYMRILTLFFFFVLSHVTWAVTISEIKIRCAEGLTCNEFEGKFDSLVGHWDEERLRDRLRLYLFDPTINKFAFEVFDQGEAFVYLTPHRTIGQIRFDINYKVDLNDLRKAFPFREGEVYDELKNSEAYSSISRYLSEHGFAQENIALEVVASENHVDLLYKINIQKVIRIHKVYLDFDAPQSLQYIKQKFREFSGELWDQLKFKVVMEQVAKELFDQGYFYSKLELQAPEKKADNRDINLHVAGKLGDRYLFSFSGNKFFSDQELSIFARNSVKETPNLFDPNEIASSIRKEYEKIGLYNNQIKFNVLKGHDRFGTVVTQVYFKISEGQKIELKNLVFSGSLHHTEGELKDFYFSQAPVLASRGFLDIEYLNRFSSILRKKYLSEGYVLAEVEAPHLVYDDVRKRATVEYKIREKERSTISHIEMKGISTALETELIDGFKNKVGAPVDITSLQDDLSKTISVLRSRGYYYAQIKNLDSDNILQYSSDATTATLSLDLDLGKKTVVDGILITGNQKTKSIVISREVEVKHGDLLTPEVLEEIKERLSGLGLFSYIRVAPLVVEDKSDKENVPVNILIQLKERDSKIVELAPGYRTDLGTKLSAKFVNNNVGGMNNTFTIQGQSNLRTSNNGFDGYRRQQNWRLLEYQLDATYIKPYLGSWPIEWENSGAYARKRYFAFDATVSRFSTQFSKTFKKVLTASLKYQVENISQFNAELEKDEGVFRIGGLTPALTLDLRDNRINPRHGAYFNLSCEFANPYFGSMRNEKNEINYYRLISRNRFYIPLSQNWNIATSLSWGQEANLSTAMRRDSDGNLIKRGYIPGIKVFRLDGIDTVRGFGDSEINRLNRPEQPDISKVRIENAAYFTNFKFEPRYLIDDTTMVGVFFDAGRVYVDAFRPLDLRTSVGLSFKVLTPVGSLDFDYGVKTKRESNDAGQRESFGHFHLSIGYF